MNAGVKVVYEQVHKLLAAILDLMRLTVGSPLHSPTAPQPSLPITTRGSPMNSGVAWSHYCRKMGIAAGSGEIIVRYWTPSFGSSRTMPLGAIYQSRGLYPGRPPTTATVDGAQRVSGDR